MRGPCICMYVIYTFGVYTNKSKAYERINLSQLWYIKLYEKAHTHAHTQYLSLYLYLSLPKYIYIYIYIYIYSLTNRLIPGHWHIECRWAEGQCDKRLHPRRTTWGVSGATCPKTAASKLVVVLRFVGVLYLCSGRGNALWGASGTWDIEKEKGGHGKKGMRNG